MGRIAETHYVVVSVAMATVYVVEERNIYWWT